MINLVQTLESCWYLSPPWGKEIPPLEVSLLEKVYVTTTKSFGYCCGVQWSAKGWSYEIVSGNDNLTVLGREIIATGNLQLVTKEKPVFGLGELVEYSDEVFTSRDAPALGGALPIARVTDYDLERL